MVYKIPWGVLIPGQWMERGREEEMLFLCWSGLLAFSLYIQYIDRPAQRYLLFAIPLPTHTRVVSILFCDFTRKSIFKIKTKIKLRLTEISTMTKTCSFCSRMPWTFNKVFITRNKFQDSCIPILLEHTPLSLSLSVSLLYSPQLFFSRFYSSNIYRKINLHKTS